MFAGYIALLFCILIINRILFGLRIMPTDIFSIVWCVFAGTASIGAYGNYTTTFETNLMVMVTIVTFDLIFTLIYSFKNRAGDRIYMDDMKSGSEKEFFESTVINHPIIVLVNVVCWAFCFPLLRRTIPILFSEGFEALRRYVFNFEDAAIMSTNTELVIVWIIQPAFVATMAIAAAAVIFKFKGRFLLLGMAVADVGISTLIFAGRGMIVKLISLFVMSIIIASGKRIFKVLIRNKWLVLLLVIGVVVVISITAERSFLGYTIMQNLYTYMAGPFIYLQRVLEEYPLYSTDMLWGTATFGCFFSAIGIVGKIFFKTDFNAPEYTIPLVTANYLDISESGSMNSMTTMIYPFLRDFGYPGLFIGPMIYAVFAALMMRNFEKQRSFRTFCLMAYVMHTLAFSVQNLVFLKFESLSIIVFIIVFTTGIRIKNGKLIVS